MKRAAMGACFATSCASCYAGLRCCPCGTTRLTTPQSYISCAVAWRPVRQSSNARHLPMASAAREAELQRAALADGEREELRAATPRHHAERDLGLPETSIFAGDDQVTAQRELVAAAQCVAADGGDQGRADAPNPIPRLGAGGGGHADRTLAGHLADVRAGGEGLVAGAGQHDAADRLVAVKRLHLVRQLGHQRPAERVELLGPVERDHRAGVVPLHAHILIWHCLSHRRLLARCTCLILLR